MEVLTGREQLEQRTAEIAQSLGRAVLLHYGGAPAEYIEPTQDRTFTLAENDFSLGNGQPLIRAYGSGALDSAVFMSLGSKHMGIHVVPCGEGMLMQYLLCRAPDRLLSREGYVHVVDSQGFAPAGMLTQEPELTWLYEYSGKPALKVLTQAKVGALDLRSPVIAVPDDALPSEIIGSSQRYGELPEHKMFAVMGEDGQWRLYQRAYLSPDLREESATCCDCGGQWYAAANDPFDAIAKAASMAAVCSRQHNTATG